MFNFSIYQDFPAKGIGNSMKMTFKRSRGESLTVWQYEQPLKGFREEGEPATPWKVLH